MGGVLEAPAWGLLSLGLIFTFALAWGFDRLWRATLGAAFLALAAISVVGRRPFGFLRRYDASVKAWCKSAMIASERGIIYSANQLVDSFAILIGVPLALSLGLLELAQYVRHTLPAKVTTTIVKGYVIPQKALLKAAKAAAAATYKSLTARIHRLEARTLHVAKATAGAIALPLPRIGRLERGAKAQGKRLTRLERFAKPVVFAGLVAAALARLGAAWIRKPCAKRTADGFCRVDPDVFAGLIAGLALVVGAQSVVRFAEGMVAVEDEMVGVLERMVIELRELA